MKKTKVLLIVILIACLMAIGLVIYFAYSKKTVFEITPGSSKKEFKNEIEIKPRPALVPLRDAKNAKREETVILYGTIIALTDNTVTVKQESGEQSGAMRTFTINAQTVVMQRIVDEKERSATLKATPEGGEAFRLRVGSFAEISYRNSASETEFAADRIIYTE